tara:strand:- start:5618 stop:5854 length:237 start_codon:yes stop_codon:yes gene_type:complete
MEKNILSKRELEVLSCIQRGMKNREAAKELNISEKTISTYVMRVKKKLGIENKYNNYFLVTKAISLGYLDFNEEGQKE